MKGRVLVVDDERAAREALVTLLSEDGWQVVQASNGQSAITTLASEGVDAVVTDLVMPGIDGLSLLQWLEHNQPRIPVCVVSGYADIARRAAIGWRAGLRYLTKPVRSDDLTGWLSAAA
jgi:DNA-binding NtrC family response regulator